MGRWLGQTISALAVKRRTGSRALSGNMTAEYGKSAAEDRLSMEQSVSVATEHQRKTDIGMTVPKHEAAIDGAQP